MKKIILLYIVTLLVFFAMGAIGALMKYYSLWYFILFLIPILVGCYTLTKISKKMRRHVNGSCALFFISFIVSIGLLIYGAKIIDTTSFFSIVYACGLFGTAITTAILMLMLRASMIYKV